MEAATFSQDQRRDKDRVTWQDRDTELEQQSRRVMDRGDED